ncbi:hypothetical protein ABBQ38_008883 [Trebouxia sp. C0009 RCD-2024]
MATLDTWGALQSCDYAVPNPFSHRTRSGRIPVIPCKYKLASGRLSCSFGQSNQPTRRAPATRPQIATRSMSSNTELEQESQTNQRTGGSSWIGNGAILALGGALPGLLVAWKWDEIGKMGHAYQSLSVVPVDAVFVLAATAFISTGDTFGTQRYGVFPKYPGPFKELDGSLFPPSYFKTYVASTPLALGIILPVIALVYMLWQHDTELAICTLGVYLVEVAAQLISERVYIQKGKKYSLYTHCECCMQKPGLWLHEAA